MEQKSNIELQIQDLEREVNSLFENIQEHESVKNENEKKQSKKQSKK